MKKIPSNLLFALLLLFIIISCSSERMDEESPSPVIPDSAPRREVQLTLRNRLSLNSSPRAIATSGENTLSTLDVYVFGSETENGTYTFQERFCYRDENSGPVPPDAGELQLSRTGSGSDAGTTGLLSLKRGLFVKLYCIANDTLPVNPATGKPLASKDWRPITFNKEKEGSPVAFAGSPAEKDFLTFHTSLLTGKVEGKNEVLRTPLAMSGALATPLDLTGSESASRLQAGFRLTRLAARFDIVNREEESRFTIQSVSLGNGRCGSTFFPIAATGNHPAGDGDLITYAGRDFAGTGFENPDANKGLSQGAFYCYPSLREDEGYLILKGLYRTNGTESREVSYRIPFRRLDADGTGSLLEINNNHRYTVGITGADDYHLDFTLNVADWNDEGSVDDYEPDNKPGEITISIPDSFKDDTEDSYDDARKIHTISMSLAAGSEFTARVGATSPLQVTKTYAGGVSSKKYDWLQVSAPIISRVGGSDYSYTFSLTKDYTAGFYPRCTVRMFDSLSGDESIIYVDALSVPQPVAEKQPDKAPNGKSDNPNTYDPVNASASLYRITGSMVRVRLACPDGLEEVTQKPAWLDVDYESQSGPEYTYRLTLNDRDVSGVDSGEVIFKNKKRDLSTILTVTLLEAPVKPDFTGVANTDNSYTPSSGTGVDYIPATVSMSVVDGNHCTIPVTSMDGVAVSMDFDGGPEWLTTGAMSASGKTVRNVETAGVQPTSGMTVKEAEAIKKAAMDAARGITTTDSGRPSARDAGTKTQTDNITFSLVNDKLAGAKPVTVTLVNTIGGPDSIFVIKPVLELGTLEKATSVPVDDVINEEGGKKKLTLYKLPKTTSYMIVRVTSYGGSTLTSSDASILKVEKTAKPAGAKARAESTADQTANVAWYKLTALKVGTATLKHCNHTDNTRFEEYGVDVTASDITTTAVDNTVILTAENGQTATAALSSPKGFTAAITGYDQPNGGTLWMGLQTTDFEGGAQTLVAQANTLTSKVRPVTVTLTNKIKDGGDLTLTFTPAAKQPVVEAVANTSSPAQNTQTDATTLKLYRVTDSKISFKASAIGGSRIESPSGVTVTDPKGSITPTEGTYDTDYTYTVTLNGDATAGSFTVVNKLHPEQSTAITVVAAETVTTAPAAARDLTVASGKYVDNTASFPEGFTTEVSWNGGSAWFTVNNGNNFGSGSQTVRCTMNTTDGMTMKPATVTLRNKIAGGENKTYTVSPVFVAPTAANGGGQAPTQNKTLASNAIKLYRVSGSKVLLKVSALGGTYLKSSVSGFNVTGGNNNNTDNVYTVTWSSGTTSGNLVFAHKQDANKTLSISVASLDPAITAVNTNVTAAANNGTTNITVSSPEGCTAAVLNNNWNGGGAWFSFSKSAVEAGNSKVFTIKQPTGNTGVTMKAVTVRLTNTIAGGPSKDITVTPTNFTGPTLSATSGSDTDFYLNATGRTKTFTFTAAAGGTGTPVSSNTGVATVSVSGTTVTVTPKGFGSCTITVPNGSDGTKKSTYSLSVSGKSYDGAAVYKDPTTGLYIAPKDAGKGSVSDGQSACAGKSVAGSSWILPSWGDWSSLNNSTSCAFLQNTVGLSVGSEYWSSTYFNSDKYFYVAFYGSSISGNNGFMLNAKQWRCFSR